MATNAALLVPTFFTVNALVMLVTRPLVGSLTDKFGFVRIGIPTFCATACSLVLIGFSNSLKELNEELKKHLERSNRKPMRTLGGRSPLELLREKLAAA